MQCSSCGSELPVGVAYCPDCGAATHDRASEAGIPAYDFTAPSSSSAEPLQAPPPLPSTSYGAPPYGIPQQTLYPSLNPYDPYATSMPPPSAPPRRKVKMGLLIGTVVLVLILVGGGVFALVRSMVKNNPLANTSTPSTITPQTSLTATATAHSTGNLETMPYPPYTGTLVLNDPLQDNGQNHSWQEISDNTKSCTFTGGAYHAKTLGGGYYYACTAQNTNFANFAYEVQMKIIKGDCGAILFRVDSSITNFYYFRVCQDGTSALFLDSNDTGSTLTPSSSNSAIHVGLNQSNLVAVVAQGSTLNFYINQQKIDSTGDSTYSQGQIGVAADGIDNHPTEVVYSTAKVWKL